MSFHTDLSKLQLVAICRDRGIKYISRMTKAQMVAAMRKNDEDPSFICDPEVKRQSYAQRDKWQRDNKEKYLEYQRRYNRERIARIRAVLSTPMDA